MNTIKIALAALAIAASASSAFAFDGTSGRSNRIVTEVPGATASYVSATPSTGSVSQAAVDTQVDFNRVHINGRAN